MAIDAHDVARAPKVTLPWIIDFVPEMRALMGEGYWPCGLAANRYVLETPL